MTQEDNDALDVSQVDSQLENPTYVLTKDLEEFQPDLVWKFLSEPQNLKDMHPLIINVEVVNRKERQDGTVTSVIDVTDELSYLCGLIKSKTTYRAYMERPPSTQEGNLLKIYFQTTAAMGITVSNRFDCASLPKGGTKLTQTTHIIAPFGLRRFVINTAKTAHSGSLDTLPSVLGSTN